MSGHNSKNLFKKLVTLAGVASASVLLSIPGLAFNLNTQSNPGNKQILAQSPSGSGTGSGTTGGTTGNPGTTGTDTDTPGSSTGTGSGTTGGTTGNPGTTDTGSGTTGGTTDTGTGTTGGITGGRTGGSNTGGVRALW